MSITEMNRICLVLFDIKNRIFGPYLVDTDRILISVTVVLATPAQAHPIHFSGSGGLWQGGLLFCAKRMDVVCASHALLKPIGYAWPYLACRIGRVVPILHSVCAWQSPSRPLEAQALLSAAHRPIAGAPPGEARAVSPQPGKGEWERLHTGPHPAAETGRPHLRHADFSLHASTTNPRSHFNERTQTHLLILFPQALCRCSV
jgi:hypothetical protein